MVIDCDNIVRPGAEFATASAALQWARSQRPLRMYSDLEKFDYSRPSFILLPWARDRSLGPLLDTFVREYTGVTFMNSLERADVAVLPFDAACLTDQPYGPASPAAVEYARAFAARARGAGVASMAVAAGDSTKRIGIDFDIVIRHSLDRGRPNSSEYCLPGWFDAGQNADPAAQVTPTPRGKVPQVGFCGQMAPRGSKVLLRRVRQKWWNLRYGAGPGADEVDALLLRRQAVDALSKSSAIRMNHIERNAFFGSLPDKEASQREYLANIEQSDYVLCVRGSGNYSFRFYDALAHGRVPIVIDTDCVFPFDELIDYSKLFPIVPANRLASVPDVVERHYRSFSDEQWGDLQRALRAFYVEWLAPVGYFKNIALIPQIGKVLAGAAK